MLSPVLQNLLLSCGLIFLLGSIMFYRKSERLAIGFLLFGALLLRFYMAQLDPFLNLWDERYHALVAKNMLQAPFKPMLYLEPALPYDFSHWQKNHVWLHKQPLFLWQIALAFKIFGVSPFVLRLPTVLMTTGVVYFIFRLGKIIANPKAGFYGAVLFAGSFFCLELCSGVMSMEHNDAAFLFYTSASVWAWAEFRNSKKRYWLFLIGLFSGMAILVKWLTGLLVFSGWGLAILTSRTERKRLGAWLEIAFSFLVCLLTFLPWQIYITRRFPKESAFEYAYNTRHIFEPVEGHEGTAWFHLENLTNLYNPVIAFLLPLALIFLLRQLKTNFFRVAVFSYISLVYLFFSVVVATKLPSYVFIVAPYLFLALGAFIFGLETFLERRLRNKTVVQVFVVFMLSLTCYFTLNYERIWNGHFSYSYYGVENYRAARINNTAIYKKLPSQFKGEPPVIFNCKRTEHIEAMFYSGFTAYDFLPKPEEVRALQTRKIKIAVFDDGKLPEYLQQDSKVVKLQDALQ